MTQEALKLALDLAIMHHTDAGYDELRLKVRQLSKEALAQPEQEPVAWMTPHGEGFRIRFLPPVNDVPLGWDALYFAPPKRPWVGLTEEQIKECFKITPDQYLTWHIYQRIEAKLKEKNS